MDKSESKSAYSLDNDCEKQARAAFERQDYSATRDILIQSLKSAQASRQLKPWLIDLTYTLATAYCLERHYDEAEQLYTSALIAQEKILGPDHPDVIASLKKLAVIIRERQGDSVAAKTIAFRVRSLGIRLNAI